MEIIKGNYGEVRFIDNMNEKYGMPSLEDKSISLTLTDPPYFVNLKANSQSKKKENADGKISYNDNLDISIMKPMLNQIFRISETTLLSPGLKNVKWYYHNTDPKDIITHYKPSGQGMCKGAYVIKSEPYLLYGVGRLGLNCYKSGLERSDRFIHPCPKPKTLWLKFIKTLKPISVLDPFMGSGTTAEVCETLGIKYLGYEIMKEYKPDIDKRIKRGIKKHTQQKIDSYF